MSKVFLTGATGFIGGNLVDYLLNSGYEVKVLVRDKKNLDFYTWKDKVDIVLGDILDTGSFKGTMDDCEVIIHSAATITFWNKLWNEVHKVNVIGTKNIVEEALKAKPKKFIQISSVAAVGFGENGEAINETHEYNWHKHNICYMETKKGAEEEVYKGIEQGLPATFVNPANVWGSGDHRGRRCLIIKAIKSGLPFYVNAGTNFVDVDAVCQAIVNSIEKGKTGERYILGGENLTIKDFFGIIRGELNIKGPIIEIPKFIVVLYIYFQELLGRLFGITPRPSASQISIIGPRIYYDSSKAIKELDMPVVSMKECIRKSISFYKEKGLI